MSDRKCAYPGCHGLHKAHGWCRRHYRYFRLYGEPRPLTDAPCVEVLPGERWVPVVGYEGLYDVSDLGRVRSLARTVLRRDGRVLPLMGRTLRQVPGGRGYLHVTLHRDGEAQTHPVHRLVGEAFLGPLPVGQQTRHGPGGALDNRLVNLSYGTPTENCDDKVRDGTLARGSRIGLAKLTEAIVCECRERYFAGGTSFMALASEFGVSSVAMRQAIRRKTWRHVA